MEERPEQIVAARRRRAQDTLALQDTRQKQVLQQFTVLQTPGVAPPQGVAMSTLPSALILRK
jgi:hypothetical protein